MLLKLGVDISRLNREIRRGLKIIDNIYITSSEEAVITSTYEGTHSAASLHYANDSVDIRFPTYEMINDIIDKLRERLGENFDVVKEPTHIHIEYDPK